MKLQLFLLLLISFDIYASFGCMDCSWHMQQRYDNKEYHVVTRAMGKHETCCPCPCRKLSLSRGECQDCHHYHYVQPWVIIRYKK